MSWRGPNSPVVAFAALAVIVGSVARFAPHMFFRIPAVGFVFHAMATGTPPPPYLSADAWTEDELRTWIRDRDVVIATGFKSGTHWMIYCGHQIRTKASDDADELFKDVNLATPFIDLIHKPGMTWAEQKDLYNTTLLPDGTPYRYYWDNPRYPFRMFKTHYAPAETGGDIPVKSFPDVKFVAMSRNGLDVVRSAIPFVDAHTDEIRSVWGGFPPQNSGDLRKDGQAMMNNLLPGGNLYNLYFNYVKMWWPLRNEPNVLLLHYADAVRDLPGTVSKLASFLGVNLSKKEHSEVTRRCGIDHMKTIGDRFVISAPLNRDNPALTVIKPWKVVRTGIIGEGEVLFNEEQRARWATAEEAEFEDPELLRWAREGGGFRLGHI